ncbi:MAG: sigma-70 family RNA polymerase sigma factor [Thermoleophilia bacterium]|nr:sigma-70 family RNA polymerase sigma factor [Thermoleophilia bacterium]
MVHADDATFSANRGVAGLTDWSMGDVTSSGGARPRYACPEDVFECEYARLVRALTIVAGEREAAADAVQEAFIRLVTRWDRVSAYEDPAGWVRRVAVNRIRDQRRSLLRQASLLARLQQERPAPEGALAADRELWGVLRSLPLKQRTAIALHYVGGLTARETAEVMHISEGTVDRHLHRALQSLRRALEEADNE